MNSSLLLHNDDSECPGTVILVVLVGKASVLENEVVFGAVRDLDLASLAIVVEFELVHAHLLDALELALDEEQVGLILDAELHLGVKITDALILEQLS